MANYMIARHSVQDFSEWKTSYDAHNSIRATAGLTQRYLLQDADDANMVTMIFEAEDLKRAQEFSQSDDLREAMQKAGVTGKPDIWFLKG